MPTFDVVEEPFDYKAAREKDRMRKLKRIEKWEKMKARKARFAAKRVVNP